MRWRSQDEVRRRGSGVVYGCMLEVVVEEVVVAEFRR